MSERIYVSYVRGHEIVSADGSDDWWYADTEVLVSESDVDSMPCAKCGEGPTEAGQDACISGLPGVINACCGHGIDPPYLQFERDGPIFRSVVEFLSHQRDD